MKRITVLILLIALTSSIFAKPKASKNAGSAGEPLFTVDYSKSEGRMYDISEYLNGRYRSNFVSIPELRQIKSMEGFNDVVGVFNLDGNTIYVGWVPTGKYIYLGVFDENMNELVGANPGAAREISSFRYTDEIGVGFVCEIELKGKKYTVAVSAIDNKQAGIWTKYNGFRLWVENSPAKDTAPSKMAATLMTPTGPSKEKIPNYEGAAIFEGVYKPGWKRLWGKVVTDERKDFYTLYPNTKVYLYNYNGTEFLCGFDRDIENGDMRTTDGEAIAFKNSSFFQFTGYDWENKKTVDGYGLGIEGEVTLGGKKVKVAMLQGDGKFRVFVKDETGYPVVANPVKTSARTSEANLNPALLKKYTRDYSKWSRVLSKNDFNKGIYKPNFELLKQIDSPNGAKYEIDGLGVYLFHTGTSWKIFCDGNTEYCGYTSSFAVEGTDIEGIEEEIYFNDKAYTVAYATTGNDYRLWLKKGPSVNNAYCVKDGMGNEYFDYADLYAGDYKAGFDRLYDQGEVAEKQQAYFTNTAFLFNYNGVDFMVGDSIDPAENVRLTNGTVIHNPESIFYYRYESDGKEILYKNISYGWEGPVTFGDKTVTMAVIVWGPQVRVFIKE